VKKISALIGLTMSVSALALPLQNQNELIQMPIEGEFIVKHASNLKLAQNQKTMFKVGSHTVSKVVVKGQKNFLNKLNKSNGVVWAQPNYEYIGNALEVEPNDPRFAEQFHHTIINTPMAWEVEMGSSDIVVAVTDNGFDLEHDDLKNSYWVNEDEIADNGIDDDNNGYIDDVNAWNFSANNNNPRPNGNSHGTHVAGIIAAEMNNAVGVAGVAPGVKVMPVKFYGEGSWTSEVVANSYAYAVNNGANIISTSFNIDGFVNDQVYKDAIKMVRDNGVLLFNSAGNGNRENPPRRIFEEVVLVCSTKSDGSRRSSADERSRFSNYGQGIDVCAPGDPILAPVNGQYQGASRYGEMSGTSMAAPTAAAVAALIWSKYPDFTAEQVLEKLYNTADDISERNSRYRGKLGAGRVNAFRAVTE
jgi:subtilisin family serine protease